MPINAHPDFLAAEKEYNEAQTLEEKLLKLKKMISLSPGHKGAENLRQQLTTRRKKLESQIIKAKKKGKSSNKGIKKEDMQAVIIGFSNVGKSSILSLLTNADPAISELKLSTTEPTVGMMHYATTDMQLIENPSIESNYYDKGLTNTADTLIIVVTSVKDIEEIKKELKKAHGKQIIVVNKTDVLDEKELRKLDAQLSTKKYNFVLVSTKNLQGIDDLKEKIFHSFDKIRVYTKEPGKEKSEKPMILEPKTTVKQAAEKILSGMSKRIKTTKIWGPSSKFAGQIVGLNHVLKDLDVIEFKTK